MSPRARSPALREQVFFEAAASILCPSPPHLRLIPRNQLGALCGRYQYFPWEKCRVSSREMGRRGCAEGDILPVGLLDIDSIHFHVFPHFLPPCSLIFNLSLAPFTAFFVSPTPYRGESGGEWTRANTTDKTKVCIAVGPLV